MIMGMPLLPNNLYWEHQGYDAEDIFWFIYSPDREIVAEIHEMAGGRFKWHHKISDWRGSEDTFEEALSSLMERV